MPIRGFDGGRAGCAAVLAEGRVFFCGDDDAVGEVVDAVETGAFAGAEGVGVDGGEDEEGEVRDTVDC